jgi:hypothetical protein
MAFIRTALIIVALLLGWTALRHQGVAGNEAQKALSFNAG